MEKKLSVLNLTEELAEKSGITISQADAFVRAFFDVLVDGLAQDNIVKVKGWGTFKLSAVSDRESVDVNTGERIIIKGYRKVSFLPETALKEHINKPFAQFETTELSDDYSIDDETLEVEGADEAAEVAEVVEAAEMPIQGVEDVPTQGIEIQPEELVVEIQQENGFLATPQQETAQEVQEEKPEPENAVVSEPEPEMEVHPEPESEAEPEPEQEIEPVVESETHSEAKEDSVAYNKEDSKAEESPVEQSEEEPSAPMQTDAEEAISAYSGAEVNADELRAAEQKTNVSKNTRRPHRSWHYWLPIVLLLLLSACLYIYITFGKGFEKPKLALTTGEKENIKVERVDFDDKKPNIVVKTDTPKQASPEPVATPTNGADTVQATPEEDNTVVVKTVEVVPEEAKTVEVKTVKAVPEEAKTVELKQPAELKPVKAKNEENPVAPGEKSLKDITMADTTAYVILGTKATHTVQEGETIVQLARKYYNDKRLWPYIVKHNGMKNPNNVQVGKSIAIPDLKAK